MTELEKEVKDLQLEMRDLKKKVSELEEDARSIRWYAGIPPKGGRGPY